MDDYVLWAIGDEVSNEDQQNVRNAVQLVHEYVVSLDLPRVERPTTFYLYQNHEALFAAYARVTGWSMESVREHWGDGTGGGEAGQGWIIVNTSAPRYRDNPLRLTRTAAHEFVHLFQHQLSELSIGGHVDEVPKGGPRWLSEGMANYFTYRAMDAAGKLDWAYLRNREPTADHIGFIESAKRVEASLSQMETYTGYRNKPGTYNNSDLAIAAVELLASRAGESSLFHFYASLRQGTTWEKEFQNSFGMAVEEFYELFADHRANGFPEVELQRNP